MGGVRRVLAAEHRRMVHVARSSPVRATRRKTSCRTRSCAVYGHWGRVRDPAGYLYRSVVNGCRSQHRRAGGEQRLRERVGRAAPRLRPRRRGRDRRDAFVSLPYRQRAALVLRFYDDLSEADTAARAGVPSGDRRLARAPGLEQLKRVIEL